jgi:hypothetical protein
MHVRKDLSISKIAEVGQIDVDQTQRILNLIIKTIVSCFKILTFY